MDIYIRYYAATMRLTSSAEGFWNFDFSYAPSVQVEKITIILVHVQIANTFKFCSFAIQWI